MSDTVKPRPPVGRFLSSEDSRQKRVENLRKQTGDPLLSLSFSGIESQSTVGNLENYIGTIQVPMGLAGPLNFNFKNGKEKIYAPIATTEAALVSSITRGSIAISTSGGVTTRLLSNRMSRSPVFQFESLDESLIFAEWTKNNLENFQALVKKKSRFANLIEIDPKILGRTVQLRFIYTTGNAAGQNMTTFCTSQICDWILKQIPEQLKFECKDFIIEGNLSSDKKVSFLTASEGRGRSVVAECVIKSSALRRILKTTASQLVQQFNVCKSSRIYSGQVGFNINVANAVAGLFLSTGQDMACVHECSVAELHLEAQGEDLYATLYMPCIVVGTVGGGTYLPGPRDSLKILGCTENDSADRLSEIIAGFALALELSTVSAISGGQFVEAHEKSARTSTSHWLKRSDIDVDFFNLHLIKDAKTEVTSVTAIQNIETEQGHVSDLAFQVSKKFCGLFAFDLTLEGPQKEKSTQVFLKIKPQDKEVIQGAARVLSVIDPLVSQTMMTQSLYLPFKNCHRREIQATQFLKNFKTPLMPEFLGSFEDQKSEAYIILQKLINSDYLMSPVDNLSVWTKPNINLVFNKISDLHSHYLNTDILTVKKQIPDLFISNDEARSSLLHLWKQLKNISFTLLPPEIMNPLDQIWERSLARYLSHEVLAAELPKTLIHNDFNTRNMALKSETDVLFFDWEFISWGLPQRDILEFLVFATDITASPESFEEYSQQYYWLLKSKTSVPITLEQWQSGMQIAFEDFLVARLPFYVIISQFSKCEYLDRVVLNLGTLGKMLK